MTDFNGFMQEWLTNPPRIVADPLLAGDHPYQCVSFVKQGLSEIDGLNIGNSWWGNAIDYWTKTNPALLATRSKHETQDVEKGDVVILRTNGTNPGDFSGEGHIGYATGNQNTTQFELLEQNGSTGNGDGGPGDVIRTRWISKSRIAGVLRSKSATPPPPPAPKYTVRETYPGGKQIKLNKQPTNLWGMNYDFEYMRDHPVEVHNLGEIWTVTNRVHHQNGYDYYRREDQVDGFNVLDCDDYTPPPPAPPSGAITFPNSTTPYEVVVPIKGYLTSNSAINHLGAAPYWEAGTYMIFNDRRNEAGEILALNITKTAGKPGAWINPSDNHEPLPEPEVIPEPTPYVGPREDTSPPPEVIPVVVEPTPVVEEPTPPPVLTWQDSFKPFINPLTKEPEPRAYKVNLPGRIWNLDEHGEKASVLLHKNEHVNVYGTVMREGSKHYRLKLKRDVEFKLWLCVPQTFNGRAGLVVPQLNWLERTFHWGEQLKSIFSDSEPKWIDSVGKPEWFKSKTNKKRK